MTVVYQGVAGETGPLYTRLLHTDPQGPHGGALFLTAEIYREREPWGAVFPVYRSDDGGHSWRLVSEVADEQFRVGNRYQPMLFELPADWAGLSRGTLLLAGNSFPADGSSTRLVVYSSDDGVSWRFLSEVDAGGPAEYDWRPTAETTAIWEPHLDLVDGRLVCYYADERRKADRMLQVLVHRTARTPDEWSEAHLDFGVADEFTRPGMFVSTGRMPDGRYRAVFEVVGPRDVPIRFAESPDGLDWADAADLGTRLRTDDGVALSGTPNVSWHVDASGRTVVIATGRLALDSRGDAVNRGLVNLAGGVGAWQSFELPVPATRALEGDSSGYSQSVICNAEGDLVQATTVRNAAGSHDIVVAVATPPW
ncbi:arabinan endo-1,5-alpha-L-arabinosidase [Microbacterium esteraromaticum]|uniref:Arabinan endo-1,5-alpha-L-arabinosidase n=1 Tax=Microbacterium esteraromaticum TaxID=57043 RepID=A0A7D8A768_9MICO|nr:exo-alpha-sialidase [Microbacterium esteraromaticum]QMU96420.1 arabinan endo-1,5-alpha-L-arabinosidase [Microbacterium esteraromaticum]